MQIIYLNIDVWLYIPKGSFKILTKFWTGWRNTIVLYSGLNVSCFHQWQLQIDNT